MQPNRRRPVCPRLMNLSLAIVGLALVSGCGANVWIEDIQIVNIPAAELDQLAVESHNGDITLTGSETATDIQVQVVTKFGGWNRASAEKCRDAIQLISEAEGERGHKLCSKWQGVRQADWRAVVNYEVKLPARLAANLVSHNGDIHTKGLQGATTILTHNGDVAVKGASSALDVTTHNGDIHASAPADSMNLATHNGDIHFDATGAKQLGGRVKSHNGTIIARINEAANTELACRTHNGRIKLTVPLTVTSISSRETIGRLGDGTARFEIETYNGNITLTK